MTTNSFSQDHELASRGVPTNPPLDLIGGLKDPAVFHEATDFSNPNPQNIEVIETHISWIFLTDSFAYKVKKPIRNEFLDYSTLQRRHFCCEEEFRLDRRYASDLYIGVVPITLDSDQLRINGSGRVVEYAVKMRRFDESAQLGKRLKLNLVEANEIKALARQLADFHLQAPRATSEQGFAGAAEVLRQAIDNIVAISGKPDLIEQESEHVAEVMEWTNWYFQLYQRQFDLRLAEGFVRECHGDLHVGNIVLWQGQLRPFDGIEFNPEFRWIDVLSDIGFLAMDLSAKQHSELCHLLVSSYLEVTGDYECLALLRWYMVYRAMVRAKVDAIRRGQLDNQPNELHLIEQDYAEHLSLAAKMIRQSKPRLWITCGLSGSGKSTGAETIVRKFGAIRLRSDVERKRIFGLQPDYRPTELEQADIYSKNATEKAYGRLLSLTRVILQAGYSVVVDAAFLRHRQRAPFQELAQSLGTDFQILFFDADMTTLRDRLDQRARSGHDASDADAGILQQQLVIREPLTAAEQAHAVRI